MPEAGQQTALSVLVTGDWVWLQDEYHAGEYHAGVAWPEDSSSCGASAGSASEMSVAAGDSTQHDPLSDRAAWPNFPPDYFGMLGRKHLRFGYEKHSKSWKYEVRQLDLDQFGGADMFYEANIRQSLNSWLEWRTLERDLHLTVQCGEMPIDVEQRWHFNKYEYIPAKHRHIEGSNTERVYHGTYCQCAARILKTQAFLCSDTSAGLGMDSHVHFPAIYTASTLEHALHYAFPCNMLGDNLYYSFAMELEVATNDVAARCNRGEILIRAGGQVLIRSVYIFFNVNIKKGHPRCAEWDPNDELFAHGALPLPANRKLRSSPWHT